MGIQFDYLLMTTDFFSSDEAMAFRFFFSLFAILMLPFASIFLSAKLRSKLGKPGVILGLIVLLIIFPTILAVIAPDLLDSPYGRFMHKSQRYYTELAHACDTVIQQHPLGTSATILQISGTTNTWAFIKIPGTDPSLPKI